MTRFIFFLLISSFQCEFGFRLPLKKELPEQGKIGNFRHETGFASVLSRFKMSSLPYETGKIQPVHLTGEDSSFIKNALQKNLLINVTDNTVDTWDDADEEGKTRIDFPEYIGAGAAIKLNQGIYLLEIIDLHAMKKDSIPSKHGIFLPKTTFLCTFDKNGKAVSAIVSNFSLGNEHGSVSRWSCLVNSQNEILVKEYGNRKEEKYSYTFTSTCKILDNGKFVKVNSAVGTK